ncbi:FkbM family methyltransferase [Aliarcobacter cryaerophilus]|nr:FkbM family methyltransferase [Arcobacter sp. AZ-2023]WNL25471.1 FkbM family methyltransferase [Arcobacter sp. AZ-2023]
MNKQRKNLKEALEVLKNNGFDPSIIFDIGVANGTKDIYEIYPNSYYYLIEPLIEFEKNMQDILKNIKGEYVLAAAGSYNGEIKINVHTDHLVGSSIFKETMGEGADGIERMVPIIRIDKIINTTIDKIINTTIDKQKILLKLDVQGAELEALNGCKNILNNIEVIITEVSMFQFMKGAPEFFDVVSYIKNINFVVYDIIFGWNRPLDNALGQVDLVFVRDSSFLRKDHSFSTIEQLKHI